jgi:hypothetical protein
MRRIVSYETLYVAVTVRSGSLCSTRRCTTVGHSEVGIPYVGCFSLGQPEDGFPQVSHPRPAGAAPVDTIYLRVQGRGRKLAIENSTPVGSGRAFIHFSSNNRTLDPTPSCPLAELAFKSLRAPTLFCYFFAVDPRWQLGMHRRIIEHE